MKSYTVGDYLLTRLQQIGINHLFGVPGDYNLHFLDSVIAQPELTWVGCANELNAAYAADGYARQRGAAALLTTFGVGELSAVNGIAGSYAEYLPVIHIVGAPVQAAQQEGRLLHHTLGDGDFGHFLRMYQEVTVASSVLTAQNAAAEIDRVLCCALRERRPGYLLLAANVAASPLAAPPTQLSWQPLPDTQQLSAFRDAAESLLTGARTVSLLADFLADRAQQQPRLSQWLRQIPMPFSTLLMGKSLLPETLAGFAGTYCGAASENRTRQMIELSDVIITAGVKYTDSITAGFSQQIEAAKTIDIGLHSCRIGGREFSNIPMADALEALYQLAQSMGHDWQQGIIAPPEPDTLPQEELNQQTLWQAMQHFVRPGDTILAEQGTAAFGMAALRLPEDTRLIVQPLWGSIGYTLPAAFGAQLAARKRRVILIIGDGSAQLTIQELGSMLRDGLNPVIFILNNDGYTVERAIHGARQPYNDIAAWNWTKLTRALSLDERAKNFRVTRPEQLQAAMAAAADSPQLTLIEVVLRRDDVPPLLQAVAEALESAQ